MSDDEKKNQPVEENAVRIGNRVFTEKPITEYLQKAPKVSLNQDDLLLK